MSRPTPHPVDPRSPRAKARAARRAPRRGIPCPLAALLAVAVVLLSASLAWLLAPLALGAWTSVPAGDRQHYGDLLIAALAAALLGTYALGATVTLIVRPVKPGSFRADTAPERGADVPPGTAPVPAPPA